MRSEEEFTSQPTSSATSGKSNITVEHDNGLDCKIEAQHSPASLQNCKHSSDFASAVVELKKRVYGQDRAINQLSKFLLLDTPRSKIIVLFGPAGVGKTYTVDMIKQNFPRQHAIRQYTRIRTRIRTYYLELDNPSVHPDLIVIDNLKKCDLISTVNFLKIHQDTYKDRCVTVLAVFNFEHIVDENINIDRTVNAIENAFRDKNIKLSNVEIIPYRSLSEDALTLCIMEATKLKVMLNSRQINVIKHIIRRDNVGCHNIFDKVRYACGEYKKGMQFHSSTCNFS